MNRPIKRAEKIEPLTRQERRDLARLEQMAESGWRDMGTALAEIRDEKLYRETHRTFAAYLREKWGMGKTQAYGQIAAAEVAQELSAIADSSDRSVRPINESQVRPLLVLTKTERKQAWAQAVKANGGGVPTARQVKAAVIEIQPAKPPGRQESDSASIVRRAIGLLQSVSQPSKNISAALDYLSQEIECGASKSAVRKQPTHENHQ